MSQDKELLKKLALAEARGEGVLGQALVIRSVLNRQEAIKSGANFNTRSTNIRDIVYAPNQYEPVGDSRNSIDQSFSAAQLSSAEKAYQLALNPAELQRRIESDGVSATNARGLVLSTGFDSLGGQGRSNAVTYRGHTFTDNINNFGVTGDSIYTESNSRYSAADAERDQEAAKLQAENERNAVAPKDKIEVSNPKELSQEALRSANAINDQVDVVNKLIKDNEGTDYDQ